ncbi:peptidase inhibitor family I36 protein [Kineococcus sp. GCM10028916]|uniref:peptidase inhibitor family I36 protein n=1 Tax=Kineococcus sp. GCM10028916 TaxID=3273394 RepID=UPI0036449895
MAVKPLRVLAVTLTAAALTVSMTSTTSAATNRSICSGDGDTLRARSYSGANFTGNVLSYYGSSPCTSTTTDADFSFSDLTTIGWNDAISSVRDYNGCDVKLYINTGFRGQAIGTPTTAAGRTSPKAGTT